MLNNMEGNNCCLVSSQRLLNTFLDFKGAKEAKRVDWHKYERRVCEICEHFGVTWKGPKCWSNLCYFLRLGSSRTTRSHRVWGWNGWRGKICKNVFVKMYYKGTKKFSLCGLILLFTSNKICLVVVIRSNWSLPNRKTSKLLMVFTTALFSRKRTCHVDELFRFSRG